MLEVALSCTNATLKMDADGVFHLRWNPGSDVSSADADAVVAAVQGMTGASLQPMLVEVVDVCMSPAARVTLLGVRFVSAVALVGATVVDRVVAGALLRNQECPHGYFTSVEDAREWLGGFPSPASWRGLLPDRASDRLLSDTLYCSRRRRAGD
ncbi:DUF7793 family protein [Arthrobacter bambusae]|uniref:DUF7793 family protein n=1 Tax=Arthrobacter bambusae TaxID=1338426 RepID=UPI00278526AE|nr:hypothetical protein [Arthrobacter bambusae]MDQ0030339.1 hypothetical protein [Arthrobacter bambusae]MDQ0098021.1 hypothetical protein [Arthrobacter bambusae]